MRRLGTSQEGRGEGGAVRIATQQEQRPDVVTAEDRADQVGDLVAGPDEGALEVGQAEPALMSFFDQAHQILIVRRDVHGKVPSYMATCAPPPPNIERGRTGATPRTARWLLMVSRTARSSVPSPASSIRAWRRW